MNKQVNIIESKKKVDELLQTSINHFKKYLDVKEQILTNEYVEYFSEFSKVVALAKSTNQLLVNKKFQKFLEGFNVNNQPIDEQIKKLTNYVTDETKAEFISDTFTKVLLTNSSKASMIMGSILHSIVEEDKNLQHAKLVCINALTNLFNNDIENIVFLNEYLHEKNKKRIYLPYLKRYCKDKSYDFSSLILTIEKSISAQIMFRDYEVDISASLDSHTESVDIDNNDLDEYYYLTKPGVLLVKYINRVFQI